MPSRETRSRPGPLRFVCAAALVASIGFGLPAEARGRGGAAAEARRHAQRASNLAAAGKCRQAVAEWDKALAILRDPALLFNRAECYRELGDVDAALGDYRQFLSELPRAPNRREVERRIAELSAREGKGPKAAQEARADSETKATTDAAAPPPPVAVAPAPAPAPPAPAEAEEPIAPREVAPPPPVVPPAEPPAASPALALTAPMEPAAPSGAADAGVTSRPWFWITVAVVAAAAGVGTFVLLSRDSTNIPSTALGNYRF